MNLPLLPPALIQACGNAVDSATYIVLKLSCQMEKTAKGKARVRLWMIAKTCEDKREWEKEVESVDIPELQ